MRREDTDISLHIDALLSGEANVEEVQRGHRILGWMLSPVMAARGLTTAPARFLGETGDEPLGGDALADFVADAYEFAVFRRLRSLGAQRALGRPIGGFVTRNLRNFLTMRQRAADRIGARVFERLEKAVQRLLSRGLLVLEVTPIGVATRTRSEDSRLHSDMILRNGRSTGSMLTPDALQAPVQGWLDDLLPDFIDAYRGTALEKVYEALARKIVTATKGASFRLGDLAKALKDQTRPRWNAYFEQQVRAVTHRDGTGHEVVELESLEDLLRELMERDLLRKLREKVEVELAKETDEAAGVALDVWSTVVEQAADPRKASVDSWSALARHHGVSRQALKDAMERISAALRRLEENELLRPSRPDSGYSDNGPV